MSYAEIGKTIGRDQAACYRAVSKHLETVRAQSAETAQELREVELQRLDRLLAVVGPMAESGDLQAVDRVLRIQERRAAYLGLDAPKAQLVAVDARPDTVRALMALVQPDANKRADDVIDVGDDSVR
jgi:cysteine synthase